MEKFKINSQDLIKGAGGNEDIFNAINSPADHIFSLQRFANGSNPSVTLRQTTSGNNATSTFLLDASGDQTYKLGGIFAGYTLGRSTDTSFGAASTYTLDLITNKHLMVAPLRASGTQTSEVYDSSYKLVAYQVGASETRIAIQYDRLLLHSETKNGKSGYWIGFGGASDVWISSSLGSMGSPNTATNISGSYASLSAGSSTTYSFGYMDLGTYQGLSTQDIFENSLVASSTGMTYTFDAYDVKLSGASGTLSTASTGSYVFKDITGKNIVFLSDTTLVLDDIKGDTEKYVLNGISTTFVGTANSDTFTFNTAGYSSGNAQSFTGIADSINSNLSVQFSLLDLGSNTGVNLDGHLYTSSNNSGTVMFSMSDTTKYITLGEGAFNLSSVGTETYILDNDASGTFALATGKNQLALARLGDDDEDDLDSVTFLANGNATVTAIVDSDDISLYGNFTSINGVDAYTETDLKFTLTDSATALFTGFGSFSDTKDGATSFVTFSDTIQISGVMSGSAVGNATYTLMNSDTKFALGANVFSVAANSAFDATKNKFSYMTATLNVDATHSNTFAPNADLGVTGYDMGSNITVASFNVASNTSVLLKGFYFGNAGSTTGTVEFLGTTGTKLSDFTSALEVSAVGTDDQSTTLVGVSSHTFTVNAGTFFLKDGGSTTKIGNLTFNEASDSHVSKLVYNATDSSVGVFGNVALVGSNTSFSYTLNEFTFGGDTASNSSIAIGTVKFEGASATVVDNATNNLYDLTSSNTSNVFSITGSLGAVSSFTMLTTATNGAGGFQFGADSATGIIFAASSTAPTSAVTAIFGAGEIANLASSTITVGSGSLHIEDADEKQGYKVLLGADGKVAGISGIDSGATIFSVASATTVITNADGIFTFSTTAVADGTFTPATATQIFEITNDADGVTFTLDQAGLVTGITGISGSAVIKITDYTVSDGDYTWSKSGTQLSGSGDNHTWSNTALGTWGTSLYMGYVVEGSGTTLSVYGIESGESLSHTNNPLTGDKLAKAGATGDSMFGLANTAFDSATQVSFINLGNSAFGASDTKANALLFTDFASNTNRMGLLYESGSSVIKIAHVPENSGSATAITLISEISDTVSLKLGDVLLTAGSEYGVSGTGVAFSVNSSIATVAATTNNPAYVGLGGAGVVFDSGTGVYNIFSGTGIGQTGNDAATLKHTLTINGGGSTGSASGTFTGDIFTMGLTNGASVTNTYLSNADMASSLTINDINSVTYGYGDDGTTTFVFTAATGSASDTLSVSLGTIKIDSGEFLATTTLGLQNDSSTLIVDAFSYTGVQEATFAIDTESSGTQMVTALSSGGSIKESVASNTAFVFNNSLFTAMGAINFQISQSSSSETLLEDSTSATGVWNKAGNYILNFATGGDVTSTTFTMQSGSSVIMTYADGQDYNAKFDYTTGASGTYTATQTQYFSVSDFYLSSGASESNLAFQYTALSETTLSLTIGEEGSHTLKLTAGGGYREVASTTNGAATTFTFDPDGTGPLPTYTYTAASILRYNIDSQTALSNGAEGLLFSGTATRILDATGVEDIANSASSIFKTFNSDTYLPGVGALMTLNIVNGQATEQFTSGTGVFTATPNVTGSDTFHFTLDGSTHSYTAITSPVTMEALFTGAANDTGTLLGATGTGVRTTSTDGDGTFWSFGKNIGNSYTMLSGSTLTLEIGGVTDSVGFGTETVTVGTGTYSVAANGFFSISDDYLNGATGTLNAQSFTYKATADGGVLTATIENGTTTILLGSVVGERTATETQTFSLASDTISGLAGGNLASLNFVSTGTLTFRLTSDTELTSAGYLYSGSGTKLYGGFESDGSATTMQRTYTFGDADNNTLNLFNPESGLATMQVTVMDGVATETFLSGSGTFTAAAGEGFYFQIGTGSVYSYTTKEGSTVTMGAYFDGTTNSDGLLYSASGVGERQTAGTETYLLIGDSFTMLEGSTKQLALANVTITDGVATGSETWSAGTGTFTAEAGGSFFLNADYYSNTAALPTSAVDNGIEFFASGTNVVLGLSVVDGSGTIKITSGVGTRELDNVSSFTVQQDATTKFFTYYVADGGAGSSVVYKIDSGTSSYQGELYAGAGTRQYGDGGSSTFMTKVTFNSDTYTPAADATMYIEAVDGKGSETFVLGSATFTAQSGVGLGIFHATMASDTKQIGDVAQVYSATATGAIFTIAIDNSETRAMSLVGATGTGITALTTAEDYTIGVLSDTYKMQEGTIKEISFNGVDSANTYVLVEGFNYTSGTGTLTLTEGSSFSVADAFLFDGANVDNFSGYVRTYTASNTTAANLTLTIDGTNTKIALGNVVGVRSENSGTSFTFANVDGNTDKTDISYTATGLGLTYQISNELLSTYSATGMLSAGEGTRIYETGNFTSTTMARTFNDDEGYMPIAGAVMGVNITNGKGTETFVSGSGTFTANTGDAFHFAIGEGEAKTYSATGVVTLGVSFSDTTDASGVLFSASGSATRLSEADESVPYYTFDGAGDSFTMNAGATITLKDMDVVNGVGTGTEIVTAGTGTYAVAAGGFFSLADEYLSGTTVTPTTSYTYVAQAEDGVLTVALENGSTTLTLNSSLKGLRTETNLANATFTLNKNTYSATGNAAAYFISQASLSDGAGGVFYNGTGERTFDGGSETTMYLSDTYAISAGTFAIEVNEGTGTEVFASGSATYTADADKVFHFALEDDKTYAYTSLADGGAILSVGVDGSNTTLYAATGTGVRTLTDATAYAVESLGDNVYSFTGVAQIAIEGVDAASETAYDGNGTLNAESGMTVIATFDSGSKIVNTAYTYSMFDANTTFAITMESGTVKTQSITAGSATRDKADDASFVYNFEGKAYTYSTTSVDGTTSAGSLTFVLDSTKPNTGAQGTLLDGFGFRNLSESQTYKYEAIADVEYTLGTDAEFKLTVDSASGTSTEDLFNVSAVTQNIDESSTFMYLGTQYTAQTGTVMQLTATNGKVEEMLSAGSALFQGTSSDTTFTYDENEYRVSGSATLRLEAGKKDPIFESGHGIKEMSDTDVFKYTDANWYTAVGNAVLTADGNEDAATVTFVSGTAVDDVAEGKTFNFTLDEDSHTYTALTGGAILGLSSTQVTGSTAEVGLVSGSATRTQDSGFAGQTFSFENAEYTATADNATLMLSLKDNTATETVVTADASRTLVGNTFVYESPNSHQTETYTASAGGINLGLHLVDGEGTETLLNGSATRLIDAGDTFTLNPSNIYDVDNMTFTAGAGGGTYQLTLENSGVSGNSGLSFMGYNVDVVTEDLIDGTGTGTLAKDSTFGFEMKVADGSNTYKATSDIVFSVTVDGGANTATWVSGSGTMELASGKEFYYTPTDGTSNTYTVLDNATFLRTGEENEYLSAGTGYRNLATADASFTATYLENTFTADAGAMIVLSSTGVTTSTEGFSSGTATFSGSEFNFDPSNSGSHTYTGDVTLQVNVADYSVEGLVGATGTGVRGLANDEVYSTTVIGNVFSASSGTYTIDFTNVTDFSNVSETFTGGTLVDNVSDTGNFYLNDEKLGVASGTTNVYTYTAVGEATLTMTVTGGAEGNIVLDGVGVRTDTSKEFSFRLNESNTYTATSDLIYKIDGASATQVGAGGYLFTGAGTRLTTTEGGSTEFNSDTYTVGASATMQLTVADAIGTEVMTQGTATYVATASSNDVFHFGSNEYKAYQSDTTLKISLEDGGDTELFYISGQGTRAAGASDTGMTMDYQGDVYTAIAGSSTILFTATGETSSASETIFGGSGVVVDNVSNTGVFHNNTTGDWLEYTAGNDVDITLTLNGDSSTYVQTFSVDPNARRTASETSFLYSGNDKTYTSTSKVDTYSLTGSGTTLTDAIFNATGIRDITIGDTATSNWANTYALTDGTYSIAIDNGTGTDVFTSGNGSQSYAANSGVFNYGDSSTKFTANIEGATLTWIVDGTGQTETLTQGAAGRVADGSGTYIMAGTANVTLGSDYSTNVTLNAVDTNTSAVDGVVTLEAITFDNFKGGVGSVTGADSLNVALGANGSIGINGKLFEATDTAAMTADSSLSVFDATNSVTISAEGDFTSGDTTLAKKNVGITDDNDVAVFFNNAGVQRLEKLTDGVTVTDAAGATKAVTDSTGTFIFNSTAEGDFAPASGTQKFNVSGDDSIIFQVDSATGLVTRITGIDASASDKVTIKIADTETEEIVEVESSGMKLERDSEGKWSTAEVVAEAFIVNVDDNEAVTVLAVEDGDTIKVDADRLGTITGAEDGSSAINIALNSSVMSSNDEDPIEVYVVNKSTDAVINVTGNATGNATISGIGYTSDTAAAQLTNTANQFIASTLEGASFGNQTTYSVTDGKFNIDASGAMDVTGNVYNTAGVTMSANDTVEVIATVAGSNKYAINGGTPVTVETSDSDGYGEFRVMLDGTELKGLDPNGVDTGAVLIDTTVDGTTFAITDTTVTVTGDTDGMTLAIKNDTLVGIDNISSDATINVSNDALSEGDTIDVNGDTVTLKAAEDGSDSIAPIKWNDTNKEWTSGNANSVTGATGYLVTVNANNEVELYFTNATQTVPTVQTTNVNDYKAVFGEDSGIAPSVDGGALPAYNGVTINGGLEDTINVSVQAGSDGIAAVVDGDDDAKDLILVTSNGKYTINGQEVIPTAQITVNASDTNAVNVTLGSAVTISHDAMQFNATSDTATASFNGDAIYLNDTSKVTNTTNDANFYVSGTVTFDNIVVKADKEDIVSVKDIAAVSSLASATGSGLTVEDEGFTLTGGDLNYTVDVTGSTPTISGIDGGSTLDGELSADAKIMTASTGVFKINASEPFTVSNDSDVTFTTANGIVTAIDSLEGVVTGNFSTGTVSIDGDHSVLVLNDDQIGVTANGTKVTEIDGVGSASTDVVVANAGGASLVTTDLNGSIYFGTPDSTSTINAQHYTVEDQDSQVSFLTSTLADYVPSVSGVRGLNDGTIAISQDESGFSVNDGDKVSLGGVGSDVTIAVANDTISSVLGLEGSVNGLSAGVVATAIDSDVTVNGATLQVVEPNGTTLNVYAAENGFDTVTGLNKDASVLMARNAYVVTEEVGAFTFGESDVPRDTYTISGDSSVTFETDGKSQVKNIADFAGTLQSTAYENTVNGAVVAVDTDAAVTDVSIVSAGTGVSSVLGLGDGDSVTVPNGTSVQMPATSSSDTDTALTVNGKTYGLEGDTDGVAIKAGSAVDTISGLAAGARLTVGASGVYNVNDEIISADIGDVIIGDEEGSAHVESPDDVNFDSDTSTEEIVNQITGAGSGSTDRYVESLEAAAADSIVDSTDPAVAASLNGNIQMTISGGTDTTESGATKPQTADFSNNTGIKKVDLQGDGDQNVKFNDEGGNIAIIDSGVGGAKNVSLGNGGDLAVVEDTGLTPVNITTGRGKDTVVTKGRNVRMNMAAGGAARVMPTAGTVELDGYDASTGAGIQLTNSNVALAVKTNAIKLQNGSTTVNGGAAVVTNPNAETVGESIVNFYNLKGLMTKVGYTHDDGGMVDLRSESGDVVMKGNYTENAAQRKGGGSTLVSGSGNDTAFGGAGDAFDLGSGDNTITLDTDRSLSESGAIVSQSATQGRTEVNNFHADYSDTGDRIRIDVTKATVQFVGGALKFVLGAATLLLNAVASNADLAESADETDSKIGTVNSQKVLMEDANGTNSYRMEVASAGDVINVERVDEVITQVYMGENSGVNLATFDESAFVNLNQGEGLLGGEHVLFGGITKLQGGSTVSTLIGNGGANNTIVAGVGGGSIWGGGASNDTMSGVGSTFEENKATSNSFFFMDGDGKDLITDFDFLDADNADVADRINIMSSAVTEVITSGNDVIISLTNEADKLTIKDAVGKDFNFDYGTNSLTAQVNTNSLDFDGRASYYQATGKNAAITANSDLSNVNIWLNNDANNSNNLFLGDIKYLNAAGVEGKATLVGNSNDNVITASTDNTSMWGGDQGGNDVMIGGAGADVFWYGKNNNGNDTIMQIDGNDTVNLYDITLEDISTADIGSNEIAITLKNTGNVWRVQGDITGGAGFRLTDGTTYTVDSNRNWVQK